MFASYMLHTWIMASILAMATGILGYFVILWRSVFAAHALPLAAFPGAAAAPLLGISPLWGLFFFSGLGVLFLRLFSLLGRKDIAMGLLLTTFLALGGLLLSMGQEYSAAVFSLLFGEILGISGRSFLPMVLIALLVLLLVLANFRSLLLQSVSPALAAAAGISRSRLDWLVLALLALVTAGALPIVGTLLTFTLLVSPAASAQRLCSHPFWSLVLSVFLAETMTWLSIAMAFWTNWPPGFFVGTLGAVLFLLSHLTARFRSGLRPSADTAGRPGLSSDPA